MDSLTATLLDAALEYARLGWQVFPCHPTGHHPLDGAKDADGRGGFHLATTDEDRIRTWWTRWPDAAIALRTGEASGVFVIDVDPRHGGDYSMDHLETEHGPLPETVESQTGGGGRHLFYRWPGRAVPCSTGTVAPGIDVKGDGGYVILPPSAHASGRSYCWLIGQEPAERGPAQAPEWLLAKVEAGRGSESPVPSPEAADDDTIPAGYRNTTLARHAGHMRRIGMGVPEITAALQETNQRRCVPPLEEWEVEKVATSIGRYDPDSAQQALVEGWPQRYLDSGDKWAKPQPIPDDLPPVKAFDPALLPAAIRPWIEDLAERMQCPIEFPAASAMVALAGMIGRRASIRPYHCDDWTEIPNLWGMLIGRPSLMKSPPMKQVLLPIRQLTAAVRAEYEAAMQVYRRQAALVDIEAKQAKRQVETALFKGEDVEVLSDRLVPDPPEKPRRRRYTVNDATVEALAEILADNPHGVLLERDEMMGFLQSLERPGQDGARAFYLECWAGNAEFESDRIARGNTRISGACLSILGTIQPGPLGTYLNAALRGGTGDDGLMQRFQLSVWPDDPEDWKVVDRPPNAKARNVAFAVFTRLENLSAMTLGAEADSLAPTGVPFFRFDGPAQERFYRWRTHWEDYCRHGDHHPAMESHLTKYRKLVPALALIIHLVDGREGSVHDPALEQAIGWAEVLESHARRIYARGIGPAVAHARALALRIVRGDLEDGFTLRDVYGKHWSLLGTRDEARMAADELVELDWLRAETQPTGGRPKRVHWINPTAYTMPV